jgi:Domain of unknown function (DUF4852)
MKISAFICLVFTGFLFFSVPNSFATSAPAQSPKIDMGALVPSSPNAAKKQVDRTYTQITYSNLYKLVWSYDAYSVDDVDALNTYLMITECALYNKYFQNEFEWEKIKNATKKFLKNNKGKAPKYSLQGFPILDSDKNFKSQKNFEFARFNTGETSCGGFDVGAMKYPGTGVLTISSPLNLTFIRVPINLAQKYIEWRDRQGIITDKDRQAYIRYRIRVDGYDGIKMFSLGVNAFGFNGKLLRLDVFADREMLLPLYNQVF